MERQALHSLSLSALQSALRAGEFTALEALDSLEARIASVDPRVGGYLSRNLEQARAEAAAADPSLPLGGVPIAI